MTKEYYRDMEFRYKSLFIFRSVMPRKHIIEYGEIESKLKQAKSKQTLVYHKLLSCISFVRPVYYDFLLLQLSSSLGVNECFHSRNNYFFGKIDMFSIYFLSCFGCRNALPFTSVRMHCLVLLFQKVF